MARKSKVGILGCGAIGSALTEFIYKSDDSTIKQYYQLAGYWDCNPAKLVPIEERLGVNLAVRDLEYLISQSDIIIEAASIDAARELLELNSIIGKKIIIVSVGVFVAFPQILKDMQEKQIFVPSGAISGIDGILASSEGKIESLRLTTTKPPASLQGINYLKDKGIDVDKLTKKTVVFQGNIKQAVEYFPQNINVAASLYLASNCYEGIEVVIQLDPDAKFNKHQIELVSSHANINLTIENKPSVSNPKTSQMTIYSVQSLLKKLAAPLKIGS